MKGVKLRNNTAKCVNIVLEPWAELVRLSPGQVANVEGGLDLRAPVFEEDVLEVVIHDDRDGLGLALYVDEDASIQISDGQRRD